MSYNAYASHSIPWASAVFLLKLWCRLKWTKCWGKLSFSSGIDTFFWQLLDASWYKNCVVQFGIVSFFSYFLYRQWALLKAHIRAFHANFHYAALTSPLQLLLVLCPPPLSFELAWAALCWLVVSVAPQIEHMFDLGSTRSTPLKYRAPVATWDRLHIEKLLVGGLHIYSKPF